MIKSKNLLPVLLVFITGFWFYWTQIRVINIRRTCYLEVFTPKPENATWSKGKVWRILYPAYDPAKGDRSLYSFWGWGYPPAETEYVNYKQCLIWNGVTNSMLDLN